MQYDSVTQKALFGNSVLASVMSGRKYDVIPQNSDFSRESICVLWCYHGNPENNLESPCIYVLIKLQKKS
jgi:hypothetical protein